MKSPTLRLTHTGALILALLLIGIDAFAGVRAAASAQSMSIPIGTPFVVVPAVDFQVKTGTAAYKSGTFSRHCENGFCSFVTSLQLPNGSKVVGMELDACDNDAFNKIRVFLHAQPIHELRSGSILLTIDTQATMGPCQFFYHVPAGAIPIDQFFADHILEVSMSEWTQGGNPPGVELRFQAVRVYYEAGEGTVVPTKGSTVVLP